jgi:hypothetical protein
MTAVDALTADGGVVPGATTIDDEIERLSLAAGPGALGSASLRWGRGRCVRVTSTSRCLGLRANPDEADPCALPGPPKDPRSRAVLRDPLLPEQASTTVAGHRPAG